MSDDDPFGDLGDGASDSTTDDDPLESPTDESTDTDTDAPAGDDDQATDSEVVERARAAGGGLRKAIGRTARTFAAATIVFFGNLTSPVPLAGRIWRGLFFAALKNYHKSAGGDRMGLEVSPNGKIDLTPVKWRGEAQTENDEAPGWKAKGKDKTWRPTTLGQSGPRLGKVPVIPLDSESWKATSVLEARVAEAVDQGDHRPLYRVDEAELTATIDVQGGAAQQPVADGGMALQNMTFDPRTSPIFEDEIIELGSSEYDGQAVSWWKTKELLAETTTQEEMAQQEQRGLIAGRSRDDIIGMAKRLFLYASLVALGGLIGPELIAAVLGGGGGGGGASSTVPIILGLM